jgi:kumamolisin
VGVFAAAGDSGSTCNGELVPGVAWPASSPYLTAVGGTRLGLNRANLRVSEVVWNDLRWLSAENGGGAGGGGLSAVSPRPPFQRGLGVPGQRRAVPDVAAHASMLPGWPVNIAGNWVEDAGTSAAAPLVAGAFAAVSARERAGGRPPLGPVNGLLYELRRRRPATLFDVVSGANGYSPKVPAHRARPGYDLASGLGVPRFGVLAGAVPRPGR